MTDVDSHSSNSAGSSSSGGSGGSGSKKLRDFVVTCDQDDKIRVSHYPNCYNIESFCLGPNASYVTGLAIVRDEATSEQLLGALHTIDRRVFAHLPDTLRAASGGDRGVVYLWDFISGKLLHSIETVRFASTLLLLTW